MRGLTGAARVAGVVGSPVRQSLSPLIHNAWIAAAGLDAAYVPFACPPERFARFVDGLRTGLVVGLNVTVPFKEEALRLAEVRDAAAEAAGAANRLLFLPDGRIEARNTDGIGLLAAFAAQAPGWRADQGVTVVLGAGGAARGAAAALVAAGGRVRVVNRTLARAEALAADFCGVEALAVDHLPAALADAAAVINATTVGLEGAEGFSIPLERLPSHAVVMDMVYKPLWTPLLRRARSLGLQTVDGLAMLIGQAVPSFEAFFDRAPPAEVDVRALALQALGEPGR